MDIKYKLLKYIQKNKMIETMCGGSEKHSREMDTDDSTPHKRQKESDDAKISFLDVTIRKNIECQKCHAIL